MVSNQSPSLKGYNMSRWFDLPQAAAGMIAVLDGKTGKILRWIPDPNAKRIWDQNDEAAAAQAQAIRNRPQCSYGKKRI